MPFIFTHIGISCLTAMDIISMFFSYFPLFSEAESSQGAPQECAYRFIGPIFIISTLPNALTRSRGEYCRVVGINIEG